jgi:hypothetical protein
MVLLSVLTLKAQEDSRLDKAQENSSLEPEIEEVGDTTGMNLQVTLITCDPGSDAYQMFGHTALRIRDLNNPLYDFAYNYGVFDSRRDNFIYYFVKGETDYVLSVDKAAYFLGRYSEYYGIPMREQVLNLTDAQKQELTRLLEINAQKENRTYRYNFLYDNCTTRAAKIVEKAVEQTGDRVVYAKKDADYEQTTFRQILHRYTAPSPWLEFGIDFVLGSEVDSPRTQEEQMFIPFIYEAELDDAVIQHADGTQTKMVEEKTTIPPVGTLEQTANFPLSPLATFLILLVFVCIMAWVDIRRGKQSTWLDITGFFIRGLAGFLVAFLFFFSEHPAVGSNWLVAAFNPLVFIMIPDVVFSTWQKRFMACVTIKGRQYDWFELVNLSVLVFTLALFVAPIQSLNIAMLPLVLTLLVRSVTRIVVLGKICGRGKDVNSEILEQREQNKLA